MSAHVERALAAISAELAARLVQMPIPGGSLFSEDEAKLLVSKRNII